MSKQLRMSGLLIGCLGLFSCTHSDPYFFLYPKIPVSVPFSIDKAGIKASIDFWIVPGGVNLERQQMVDFRFDRMKGADPIDYVSGTPPRVRIPVKIRVFLIDNQTVKRIPTTDYGKPPSEVKSEDALPNSMKNADSDIAYLSLESSWDDYGEMVVASFWLREYGHYRVYIETLRDAPEFKNVKSELEIKEIYNQGE